jgi:hypothetical protein
MSYEIRNSLDKGYFNILKTFRGNNYKYTLNEIIDKYSLDFNDYHIIKKTNFFRILNIKDIEKYAGVVCFHKDMYSLEYINRWIDFLYKELKIQPQFISKPFPPEYMLNKIKVIQ